MSEIQCCPLSDDGDRASVCRSETRKAAKNHRCDECFGAISKGAEYEYVTGLWDGHWSTFRTCSTCVEIRRHFACGGGWMYGGLWTDLEQNFLPTMRAGGPCLEGLSPVAKGKLFLRRLSLLGMA